MPREKASEKPPVMTWVKAAPVFIVAFVFYAVRFLFEQFWFFGPALTALYCASKVSGVLGSFLGGTLCSVAAGAAGYFGSPVFATFGAVMAMAVGFCGWLVVGMIILMTNQRVFREDRTSVLWFLGGLLIAEVPFIGSLPGILGATFKLYVGQIKRDREKLKAYEAARVLEEQQGRASKIVAIAQARAAARLAQDNAADDYYEDSNEIPEGVPRAA